MDSLLPMDEPKEFLADCDRKEAVEKAPKVHHYEGEFWVGELVPVECPKVNAKIFLENMNETYSEKIGTEAVADWPFESVEQKDMDALGSGLTKVLQDWLTKHDAVPTFGTIENVTKHEVAVAEAAGE